MNYRAIYSNRQSAASSFPHLGCPEAFLSKWTFERVGFVHLAYEPRLPLGARHDLKVALESQVHLRAVDTDWGRNRRWITYGG